MAQDLPKSDLDAQLLRLGQLSPDLLQRILDPLLEPARADTVISPEASALVESVRKRVSNDESQISPDLARRIAAAIPVGKEVLRRRRLAGVSRAELAVKAGIADSTGRLDLLENESRPSSELFTSNEVRQLFEILDRLRTYPLFSFPLQVRDVQVIDIPNARSTGHQLLDDLDTIEQVSILAEAQIVLEGWIARLWAANHTLNFYSTIYWQARKRWFSRSRTIDPQDIADLLFGLSVHRCSYLTAPGVASVVEPGSQRVKVPSTFSDDAALFNVPGLRPSESCLRRFALAHSIAKVKLFDQVAEPIVVPLTGLKYEVPRPFETKRDGSESLAIQAYDSRDAYVSNLFAHELLLPTVTLDHELERLHLKRKRESVVRVLEDLGISGFVALDRLNMFDSDESLGEEKISNALDSLPLSNLPQHARDYVLSMGHDLEEARVALNSELARIVRKLEGSEIVPYEPMDHLIYHLSGVIESKLTATMEFTAAIERTKEIAPNSIEEVMERLGIENKPVDNLPQFEKEMDDLRDKLIENA